MSKNSLFPKLAPCQEEKCTPGVEQRKGKFELANRGTLFLDEVGELSPVTQANVLRVLGEQRVTVPLCFLLFSGLLT